MSFEPAAALRGKDLVGIDPLEPAEIQLILDTASRRMNIGMARSSAAVSGSTEQ